MLWLRKQRDAAAEAMPDVIAPAELPVQFDEERFRSHMTMLLEVARVDGGVDAYLEALGAKQRLFSEVLAEPRGTAPDGPARNKR